MEQPRSITWITRSIAVLSLFVVVFVASWLLVNSLFPDPPALGQMEGSTYSVAGATLSLLDAVMPPTVQVGSDQGRVSFYTRGALVILYVWAARTPDSAAPSAALAAIEKRITESLLSDAQLDFRDGRGTGTSPYISLLYRVPSTGRWIHWLARIDSGSNLAVSATAFSADEASEAARKYAASFSFRSPQ